MKRCSAHENNEEINLQMKKTKGNERIGKGMKRVKVRKILKKDIYR